MWHLASQNSAGEQCSRRQTSQCKCTPDSRPAHCIRHTISSPGHPVPNANGPRRGALLTCPGRFSGRRGRLCRAFCRELSSTATGPFVAAKLDPIGSFYFCASISREEPGFLKPALLTRFKDAKFFFSCVPPNGASCSQPQSMPSRLAFSSSIGRR